MAHVLIASDLSAHSLNAARYAVALFGLEGNSFTVLHTFFPPPSEPGSMGLDNDPAGRLAAEGVATFAQELAATRAEGELDVAAVSAYGELDVVLRDMATGPERPDVVVMGGRATSSIERTLFGSSTAAVIRHAGLPVLVIPSEVRYRNPGHIILADDGGAVDRDAVKLLLDIARWSRSELKLVHVVPESRLDEEVMPESRYDRLLGAIPHTFHTVSGDNILIALNDLADQSDADLVVVVHRQRGALEGLFHHSIAADLALHTHIPILVLQQAG